MFERQFFQSPKSLTSKRIRFDSAGSWASGAFLLRIVDSILVLLIVLFPFVMGGREAWGHRILISLAAVLGFVWCLHRARSGGRLMLSWLEPLLIAGLLLVWLQTVPLSSSLLNSLSPEYQRLLPAWSQTQTSLPEADTAAKSGAAESAAPESAAGKSGTAWSTSSLYPTETRHALLLLLAYGIIGIVVFQRLNSDEDCHRLLRLVAVSGLTMAGFAVIQLVTSNDLFFWFYRHPYTGTREVLKGAFTNRNHFAQFLALSLGPLIWWMLVRHEQQASRQPSMRPGTAGELNPFGQFVNSRTILLTCATGGVLLSIMLSLSRGGMIAAGLACCISLAILWKSGRVKSSLAGAVLALGIISIVGIIAFGSDSVEDRIGQLASADANQIDRLNARRSIWNADIAAIKAFPLIGTGVGTHRFVYPIYMEDLARFPGVTFSHAESSYIHLAMETGLCGAGLLIAGLMVLLGRLGIYVVGKNDTGRIAALAAVSGSLAGGTVHAVVDFIWYAPAIVVSTIVLAAVGLRLCSGFQTNQGIRIPRVVWFTVGAACLLLACRAQPDLTNRVAGERLWFQYLNSQIDATRSSIIHQTSGSHSVDAESLLTSLDSDLLSDAGMLASAPLNASEHNAADVMESQKQSLRVRIELLLASLKANPRQAEANLHLAVRCSELFELLQSQSENRMTLPQIRETVISSKFTSTDDMHRFLKKAFGSNIRLPLLTAEFVRRSLRDCPVGDKAYECISVTNFLKDPQDRQYDDFVRQTLIHGVHSPRTLQTVGLRLLTEGRTLEAMPLLARAFHSSAEIRQEICRSLSENQPVDVVLTQFNPSLDELDEVLDVYASRGRASDIRKLTWMIGTSVQRGNSGSQASSDVDQSSQAELLMDAYRTAYEAGIHDHCEQLLNLAIERDPEAEPPRRALGLLMLEQKQYADAEHHFAWCNEQFPGDEKLEELRRDCRRLAANQSRRVVPASFERQ
jgi:hypothetical protein